MEDFDEVFYEIAQDVISRAMAVKCDIPTYIDGLNGIMDELQTAKQAAESDLKSFEEE